MSVLNDVGLMYVTSCSGSDNFLVSKGIDISSQENPPHFLPDTEVGFTGEELIFAIHAVLKEYPSEGPSWAEADIQDMTMYSHSSAMTNNCGLMHSLAHTRWTTRSTVHALVPFVEDGYEYICQVVTYVRCVPSVGSCTERGLKVNRFAVCHSYQHPGQLVHPSLQPQCDEPRHSAVHGGIGSGGCRLAHADFGVLYVAEQKFRNTALPNRQPKYTQDLAQTFLDLRWLVPLESLSRKLAYCAMDGVRGGPGKPVRLYFVPHAFRGQ
jgi:hypothetical protein